MTKSITRTTRNCTQVVHPHNEATTGALLVTVSAYSSPWGRTWPWQSPLGASTAAAGSSSVFALGRAPARGLVEPERPPTEGALGRGWERGPTRQETPSGMPMTPLRGHSSSWRPSCTWWPPCSRGGGANRLGDWEISDVVVSIKLAKRYPLALWIHIRHDHTCRGVHILIVREAKWDVIQICVHKFSILLLNIYNLMTWFLNCWN
jgi:hypothetical protein